MSVTITDLSGSSFQLSEAELLSGSHDAAASFEEVTVGHVRELAALRRFPDAPLNMVQLFNDGELLSDFSRLSDLAGEGHELDHNKEDRETLHFHLLLKSPRCGEPPAGFGDCLNDIRTLLEIGDEIEKIETSQEKRRWIMGTDIRGDGLQVLFPPGSVDRKRLDRLMGQLIFDTSRHAVEHYCCRQWRQCTMFDIYTYNEDKYESLKDLPILKSLRFAHTMWELIVSAVRSVGEASSLCANGALNELETLLYWLPPRALLGLAKTRDDDSDGSIREHLLSFFIEKVSCGDVGHIFCERVEQDNMDSEPDADVDDPYEDVDRVAHPQFVSGVLDVASRVLHHMVRAVGFLAADSDRTDKTARTSLRDQFLTLLLREYGGDSSALHLLAECFSICRFDFRCVTPAHSAQPRLSLRDIESSTHGHMAEKAKSVLKSSSDRLSEILPVMNGVGDTQKEGCRTSKQRFGLEKRLLLVSCTGAILKMLDGCYGIVGNMNRIWGDDSMELDFLSRILGDEDEDDSEHSAAEEEKRLEDKRLFKERNQIKVKLVEDLVELLSRHLIEALDFFPEHPIIYQIRNPNTTSETTESAQVSDDLCSVHDLSLNELPPDAVHRFATPRHWCSIPDTLKPLSSSNTPWPFGTSEDSHSEPPYSPSVLERAEWNVQNPGLIALFRSSFRRKWERVSCSVSESSVVSYIRSRPMHFWPALADALGVSMAQVFGCGPSAMMECEG